MRLRKNLPSVNNFRRAQRHVIHEWSAWRLVRGHFVAPDGDEFVRTYVESPGAAGIVAIANNSRGSLEVVMVHQYRPSLDAWSLEIPAGMRDVEGEDPLLTAKRELREEAGLVAARWDSLGQIVQAPAVSNGTVQIFLARDLSVVEVDRHGPEEQVMTIERYSLDEALAMIDRGEIDNAMAVVGILRGIRFIAAHP